MKKKFFYIMAAVALLISGCETIDVEPDPDSLLSKATLSANKLAVLEDGGSLEITVTLSVASANNVAVELAYSGGATFDVDYSVGTNIMIPAGSLSGSVTLTTTDDSEEEGLEKIDVSIKAITGASKGEVTSISINLEDDDVAATVQLLLNEILYDPSNSGLNGDANGDGTYAQAQDEFIELINMSAQALDLSGYKVFDTENLTINTPNHTFPDGTIIQPGKCIIVFGGGTPTGSFGGSTVQTSTSGDMNLNNAGDELIIQDADGKEILRFDIEPLSNNPNESYTRNPDLTGDFEQHSNNHTTLFSPGTKTDGSAF